MEKVSFVELRCEIVKVKCYCETRSKIKIARSENENQNKLMKDKLDLFKIVNYGCEGSEELETSVN